MSSYVMLADIPETDRCAFLNSLAKRQAEAEGIPATLPAAWNRPHWLPPAIWPQDASPTNMQFETISDAYWLEALSGRVSVAFDQNTVFWGDQGYLRVRVLRPEFTTIPTGTPGRPPKGKQLIEGEFQCRAAANECKDTLEDEAQALHAWFKTQNPTADLPTQKTIANNIRTPYRQWRAQRYPTK